MCSIDGEPAKVLVARKVIAKKQHKCCECSRTINVGEEYRRSFGVWDNSPQTYKTCSHCCVAQDWLEYNCNAFMFTGLREEIEEHAYDYPELRMQLLRVKVGMRRNWQSMIAENILLPLPKCPRNISAFYQMRV